MDTTKIKVREGRRVYTVPQPAPWKIGDRLRFIGNRNGTMSGFHDDDGNTVWSHKFGVIYKVIGIRPPDGSAVITDEETGEKYLQLYHGWNVLRSELDPEGRHEKGIDVESVHEYELIRP